MARIVLVQKPGGGTNLKIFSLNRPRRSSKVDHVEQGVSILFLHGQEMVRIHSLAIAVLHL